jgi:hypothetical protein
MSGWDAGFAIPNRLRRALATGADVSARQACEGEEFGSRAARRTHMFAARPVKREWTSADINGRLRVEMKISSSDDLMDGIRRDLPRSQAVIPEFNDVNLACYGITAQSEHRKGGAADPAGQRSCEQRPGHGRTGRGRQGRRSGNARPWRSPLSAAYSPLLTARATGTTNRAGSSGPRHPVRVRPSAIPSIEADRTTAARTRSS